MTEPKTAVCLRGRSPGRHSRRAHDRPGGRRRPRKRRRPDHRRRKNHAGSHQLHGEIRPRADLPGADRAALRRAGPGADHAAQYFDAFGTPFCEPIDARARHHHRNQRLATAPPPFWRPPIPKRARKIWRGPATSTPCARATAACWCAPGRPKRPWIWRGIAGLDHSGVICEIMNDDGSMARMPQLVEFCRLHGYEAADRGRPDPLPHAARALRAAHRRIGAAHALRRFPDDRLCQRRRQRTARRAGARRMYAMLRSGQPEPAVG